MSQECRSCISSHAHSDHYTNLSKSWKEGPIYCSETTANLIIHMLGVEPQWVVSALVSHGTYRDYGRLSGYSMDFQTMFHLKCQIPEG